jgi:hypothetical protein
MRSPVDGRTRWRWREVSPRRVIGAFLLALGLIGVGSTIDLLVSGGPWDPAFDTPMLSVSIGLLLVGLLVLWRTKPAPWP